MSNSATPWTATCQASLFHYLPEFCSNSYPLSQGCHLIISASVTPLSSCPQSFPASRSFPMSWLLASNGQSIDASASVSVVPMNIQDWLPLDWLFWSPCSPRDSQESSPAPQFKSIDFLALCILYDPTLTSIYIFWKNHSFEYTKLMAKWCLYYLIHCLGLP